MRLPAAALAAHDLLTEPQTAEEIVSFLSFRPVYVFFYPKIKKTKKIVVFDIIFHFISSNLNSCFLKE